MSELSNESMPPSSEIERPLTNKLLVWSLAASQVAAGAYGGWDAHEFLSWHSVLVCVLIGVAVMSANEIIAWVRFPGRYEDGSLHWRSLIAAIVVNGMLGGAFWGLILLAVAWLTSCLLVRLSLDDAHETIRIGLGGAVGAFVGAIVLWQMLRRPK